MAEQESGSQACGPPSSNGPGPVVPGKLSWKLVGAERQYGQQVLRLRACLLHTCWKGKIGNGCVA